MPFEVGVFSPSGAWLGIVRVETRAQADAVRDLVLPAARSTEVFVSAGTAASLLAPPANPVSLISKRELDERQPNRLSETIETLPGVSKSDESTSSVPVVRGLARGRTLLMLDDGRVTAERRVGPSASYLNPFALESVEIVRGPGSVAYGSDAFGGVIHAKTAMPTLGELSGRYTLAAGTGGTPEAAGGAGINIPAGPAAFSLALYQRSQSDYESPAGTQDNSSVRDRGFVVHGLVPVGKARLWAGFQLDEVRDMGKPQADLPTTRTFYPFEDSSRFTLGLDVPDVIGFSSLELRAFYGAYGIATERQRVPNATTTLRNSISDVDANDFSVRLLARRSLGTAGLRVGVDVNGRTGLEALNIVESFDKAGNPTTTTTEVAVEDASKTDWGAFAEGDIPLAGDRLMLTAGIRGDHVSTQNTGGYYGDLSTSDGAFSGYGTLTWTFAPEWKASAQYSSGYRDPTLSDRYFRGVSGRGFVIGNPDLVAETSNQWDLSVRGRYRPGQPRSLGLSLPDQGPDRALPGGRQLRVPESGRGRDQGRRARGRRQGRATDRRSRRGRARTGQDPRRRNVGPDIAPPTAQLIVDHEPFAGLFWRARLLAVARDERPGRSGGRRRRVRPVRPLRGLPFHRPPHRHDHGA